LGSIGAIALEGVQDSRRANGMAMSLETNEMASWIPPAAGTQSVENRRPPAHKAQIGDAACGEQKAADRAMCVARKADLAHPGSE
jgi:hypothetical protein